MHEILMPKAGSSMEDGTIVQWLKAEGDPVEQGEVLVEIETDRATIEVEAGHGGTLLKIVAAEGETVPAGALIGVLGDAGEDVSAAVAKARAAPAAEEVVAERVEATPEAKGQPAAPGGKVTPVLMPQAGNSMEEGTVVKWCVAVGDTIAKGDVIFEVETDKATIEVEATDGGRLARIVVGVDETIEVLLPVAYLADDDGDVDGYIAAHGESGGAVKAAAPAVVETKSAEKQAVRGAVAVVEVGGRVKASPAARRVASERGVDISTIKSGSGPGGRILTGDVPAGGAGAKPEAAPAPRRAATGEVVRKRMSGMRKAIARALSKSKQTIPHFYMRMTIDAGPLMSFYRGEKAKYQCTLNDVIVLACGRVMQEFPAFRSQIDGDEIVETPTSNVGIAVGMDDGLVVPVVVGVEGMSLAQLGGESKRIVEAARGGKIEGMGQGLLTITNLGMFGVEEFAGIINPPEAAILAVGTIREQVIVSDGAMRPGKVMTMTLSADHRVVDGLAGAKFLARLKEILETPALLG